MASDGYGYGGYAPPPVADHYQSTYGQPPPYGAPPPAYGGYHAPPPAYGAPAPGGYPPAGEEIRTIFITGFPNDVKERELNNLLRFLPGYEASQLNWNKNMAQGFAMFSTAGLARAACDQITQHMFDESTSSVLRCEMARKNMYIKDDPSVKRPRTGPGAFSGGSSFSGGYSGGAPSFKPQFSGPSAQSMGDNPPCNTLFIGNLSDIVNENELRSLFANQPGFSQVKVVRSGRSTSAFVEFDETAQATAAHQSKQGATVPSSDRGPLRIQYARNPFGKKRDVNGNLIDTPYKDGVPGM